MNIIATAQDLDKWGYGVNRDMSRKEWQQLCLQKLLSGFEQFNSWQQQLIEAERAEDRSNPNLYEWIISFQEDGKTVTEKFTWSIQLSRHVVDISGHVFEDICSFACGIDPR